MGYGRRLACLSTHVACTRPSRAINTAFGIVAYNAAPQPSEGSVIHAAHTSGQPSLSLTEQQLAFMDTFGYLVLRGAVGDKIDEITAAFDAVWDVDPATGVPQRPGFGSRGPGKPHDDTGRTWLGPFIDQHPTLCALLDDPRVDGIFATLLGHDYTYWGSDGNFFAGNTGCELV